MGGVGIGTVAQVVTGVGGLVGSVVSAKSQANSLNQMMNEGAGQRAQVAGIDEYFLGGGKAQALDIPGMQDIFAEVDSSVQEQLRNLDSQAAKSRQMIADNIPQGGAKLRALADLAMEVQDARGKVIREAQTKKQELDVQLTNQYLQQAMGRQVGASADSKMYATLQDYGNRQKDIAALGQTLGTMTGQIGGQTQTDNGITYTGPTQTQATMPSAVEWGGKTREDYVSDPYKSKMKIDWNL